MDFPLSLLPLPVFLALDALMGGILAWLAWRTPWRTLDRGALNAWIGACVLAMALWALRGEYRPGLSFHLLGMTTLTLMMGVDLALLATAVAMAGAVLGRADSLLPLGLDWLVSGVLPILFTRGALWVTQRTLPANYFVYFFFNAFLAGGVSMTLCGLASVLVQGFAGAHDWSMLLDEALPYYFLLSWSEAFTSGLLMAVLVVYRPRWVRTFDDARYLADRPDDF